TAPGATRREIAETVRCPTSFTDEALLLETLHGLGAQPERTGTGDIVGRLGACELRFTRGNEPAFFVEISGAPSAGEIRRHLENLDEDYRRCVQAAVYEKIKARSESQGLTLESEEILEDKTILITLRVD
ncbi:MAG: hypothetical protein LBS70_04095, partial [Candidatus Accumulibacter sp.]|nr:hypothetical protein [Accumulibacter sp.]